ncbi:TrkA C-terminal domain-containing protein [Anaerospora hongkongensis]|uniref:TrkA C-terminal domain-containing protein n=1 Tax=Anaerospora hongkongensis TaxID=244830 RepID=UPI00289641C7|nr:TrkA C-terminal domain-containing protein [Anaerospora hongkongensis]
MEMTGSFHHMLSLIVVSMTAYLIADLVKSKPIYEELLERALNKQRKTPIDTSSEKRMLLELVICMGSKLDGKQIKCVEWPFQCLLVSIKRGELELVPKGNTRLIAGDYLYVLLNVDQVNQLRELAEECTPHVS